MLQLQLFKNSIFTMKICAELIQKLQIELDNNATPQQLITITQELQQHLQQLLPTTTPVQTSKKISVLLPSNYVQSVSTIIPAIETLAAILPIKNEDMQPQQTAEILHIKEHEFEDLPIIAQQHTVLEINDITQQSNELNEKYNRTETLLETPLKDLKKGIGLNDKFLFINELFRGDEIMYERSIKTINSFAIYPEAQYWIERELTTKIGWDTKNDTVQHFYNLVKRRFSTT